MPPPPNHFPVKLKFAGVDLRAAVDQLGPGRFRIAKNLKPTIEGALKTREGTKLVNASPLPQNSVHSLMYLNDPVKSANIMLAGDGNNMCNVATQAVLDTGYSGNPLSHVEYRASGDSSAFEIVGDSSKMSKFSSAGTRTQLGITPLATQINTHTPAPNLVLIDTLAVDHFAYHGIASHSAASSFANGVVAKNSAALQIETASPLPTGEGNFTYVTPLDLTEINGIPATDGDYFHLWVNVDNPASIQEIRIYFDVDPKSVTGGVFNSYSFTGNFYWVSISGAALQGIINYTQTTLAARAAALATAQTAVGQFPPNYAPLTGLPDNFNTAVPSQVYSGAIQWTELKIPRSQFIRAGSDSTLGWSTVQGFSITVIPTPYTQPVATFNDLYFYGGFGPDSTYGDFGYDYVQTFKSSVTLSESNLNTIQNGAAGSDNNGLGPDYSGTSILNPVVLSGGNGYNANDILSLVGGGSAGNTARVVVVSAPGGVVATVQVDTAGYGYQVEPSVATVAVTGTGNNCTLAIPELISGLVVQRNPVLFTPTLSADSQVDTLCFYRRGGTLEDDWRLVAQQANSNNIAVTGAVYNATTGLVSANTSIPHQFILNQGVKLTGVWTAATTPYVQVTATPSNNTFQYAVTGSQGAFTAGGNAVACDLQSDTEIASASTVPQTNDVPVTTVNSSGTTVYAQPLPFIWGPQNGTTLFGCGDLNRPGFAYWCNPGNPDGWSSIQNVEVTQPSDPLQNGFFWGGSSWVFSQNKLFQLVNAQVGVNSYVPVGTPCNNGLAARWGLAAGPETPAVWFVAKDGVWEIEPGSAPVCITSDDIYPLFQGETVEGNAPIDFSAETKIRLAYFDEEVWFTFQDITGAQQVWIYERSQSWVYDRPKRRWRQASYSFGPLCVYPQPQATLGAPGSSNILLLGGSNNNVYQQDNTDSVYTDGNNAFPCTMRTGAYDFEDPQQWKEFVSIVADYIANAASITPTALYNDEQTSVALAAITGGTGRVQQDISLSDTYARSISFQLSWSSNNSVTIEGFEIAWRPDEMPVVHTEVPASALDMPGYGHMYDGYIGLRSSNNVTVNVYTEDANGYAPAAITIPSTGNNRQRVYLQFGPNKSRNFRVSLDSNNTAYPFRVYPEDSYINVMPWGGITPTAVALPFKA